MMPKTDEQIKQAVTEELRWDSRVEETEVGVTVVQGTVTLTGEVGSYAKKLAAQEAAHRVVGVLDVANDIKVKVPGAYERTDTEIAQAVRRSLEWDVQVNDQRIHSTVVNGWVTLEGDVTTLAEKYDAERAIESLVGVHGVNNVLTVTPRVTTNDIHQMIEHALERRADHEANRINVSIRDGAVTISGKVRNYGEKRAVIGAVSHAPGVRSVTDQLHISPFA